MILFLRPLIFRAGCKIAWVNVMSCYGGMSRDIMVGRQVKSWHDVTCCHCVASCWQRWTKDTPMLRLIVYWGQEVYRQEERGVPGSPWQRYHSGLLSTTKRGRPKDPWPCVLSLPPHLLVAPPGKWQYINNIVLPYVYYSVTLPQMPDMTQYTHIRNVKIQ